MNLNQLIAECKSVNFKPISKTAFSFYGENSRVKLLGKCKNTILEAKLVSRSGAVLYNVKEDCLKKEFVESRIKDMHKMFEQAALIEMDDTSDLDRTSNEEDKKLLLDATEDIEVPETNEETPKPVEEERIKTLTQFKDELINLATRASGLIELFSEDDIINRSMIIGLISGVYEVAQDTADLEEDLAKVEESTKEEAKECMCIPSKTQYIDLACKGLGQACYALNKVKNYNEILGILEDIKSELVTSK